LGVGVAAGPGELDEHGRSVMNVADIANTIDD
jgi:hypothetical protein